MKLSLNKILIFFGIFTVVFFFLLTRSAEHISQNFIFILDQGRDYIFVRDMVLNQKLTLIGSEIGGGFAGIQGIFQGPVHFYILSLFFLLFNGNPYGGVVYMTIFAVLAVILGFYFGKKTLNTLAGFVIAFLITVSPPLIAQAKFVWNPYPITSFLILCFLFVYLSKKKKLKYIFLSSFFATFTYNFEIATTVPLVIALLLYFVFVLRLNKIKQYLVLFLGFILGMAPFVLFEVRHNFIAFNGFLKYLSEGHSDKSYGLVNNHLGSFIYNFNDTFPSIPLTHGSFMILIFLFVTLFLLKKEKRAEIKTFMLFLLLLVFSSIFVLSFLRNHIFMYYLYQLNLVYVFIFAYIIYASFTLKQQAIKVVFVLLLIVYGIFSLVTGLKSFKNDTSDLHVLQKIKGKSEAVDYIFNDAKGEKFGLFVFAPTVYTYPYDYVSWWKGKNQYKYIPSQSKDGLFYLLIEKDPQKPWSDKGWQETVIKSGKVISTYTLPSGLIVQKRCGPNCPIE